MNNSEKYHFPDFTQSHYAELLKVVKLISEPIFYSEITKDENVILWRHDVDLSLDRALDLAKIESQEGIRATYFILLHSEFYSPFEKKAAQIIRQIIELGHKIGLHFDTHFYGITTELELEDKLIFEKHLLEKTFNTVVDVFSFHNTTEFTMNCKAWQYGGLINTYAAYFQEQTNYCSDSNGYWRFKRLWDFLNDPQDKSLQILTHPEWWTSEVMSPKQKIDQIIEDRAFQTKFLYESSLKAYGRENIDW